MAIESFDAVATTGNCPKVLGTKQCNAVQGESVLRPAVLQLLKELGLAARVDPYNKGTSHSALCVPPSCCFDLLANSLRASNTSCTRVAELHLHS